MDAMMAESQCFLDLDVIGQPGLGAPISMPSVTGQESRDLT